jgi:exodeoxyribonuclease VII small subunit
MARKTQPVPRSFEEALAELEKILADLEGGQVGLEESLARYERGSFLIRHCRDVLATAEKQIEQLVKDEQGQPQTAPLDDADEA